MKTPYQPCEVDGRPCEWEIDECPELEDGTAPWDLYCTKCNRWRDWDEAAPPEAEDAGGGS